jgi:transcriptional regulator with XRE-family HTH domain
VPTVDTKREIREFLTSRRARITPAQAGLRTYGNGPRRVPGLRREEVALLAGVSIAYYTKLERGDTSGVSETVLESLARALQLDDAEQAHLFDLARAQSTTARPRRSRAPQRVRRGVQRLLDSITAPAMARNGRMDILATNPLGRALYSEMFANPRTPVNSARFTFLDPRATSFFVDWDHAADDSVAVLRGEAGRNPTTAPSPTSSANSRHKARSSAPAGRDTTSATTTRARSASTTRSSAISNSPSRC